MESFSFINNDDKIEFKILRAKQSDEFDNGYHFVSQLLLSKKIFTFALKKLN